MTRVLTMPPPGGVAGKLSAGICHQYTVPIDKSQRLMVSYTS